MNELIRIYQPNIAPNLSNIPNSSSLDKTGGRYTGQDFYDIKSFREKIKKKMIGAFENEKIKKLKILVPIDFSSNSRTAYEYAKCIAAQQQDVEIHLVHVWQGVLILQEPPVIIPLDKMKEEKEEKLHNFVKHYPEDCKASPPSNLKYFLSEGIPTDNIIELSKNYDLIVMGSKGESNFLNRIFGTVSTTVCRAAHCPVMIVPDGVSYEPNQKVMFALDEHFEYGDMIHNALQKASILGKEIHFVQVVDEDYNQEIDTRIKEEILASDSPISFKITRIKNKAIDEALNEYAKTNAINSLVMITKHRPFWESWFHRSQTKKMALHTNIPLLVFHQEDDE